MKFFILSYLDNTNRNIVWGVISIISLREIITIKELIALCVLDPFNIM